MKAYVDDGIFGSFQMLRLLAREVALQQMSKSGNAVREGMRTSLKSESTKYLTRVGAAGAYLEKNTGARQYGLRESHTVDEQASNPASMASMISSFLMEKSDTLVVGGMNPRFRPILRKDGEVVGTGSPQSAVSPSTAAILTRMDTGKELPDYPTRSQLAEDTIPRLFMVTGIQNTQSQVKDYLTRGFETVVARAVNQKEITRIRKVIGA